MTVTGINNGDICGNEKEILRAVMPGVKAEDYEVKNLWFTNLLAFIIAKSINESLGTTLFDYGVIFKDSDSGIASAMKLEFFGNEFSDDRYNEAASILRSGCLNLLNGAIIAEAAARINPTTIPTVIANALQYAATELTRIKGQFWYTSEATLKELEDTGDSDYFCMKVSGIALKYPDHILKNLGVRNNVLTKWFGIVVSNIASLYNDIVQMIGALMSTPIQPVSSPSPANVTVNVQVPQMQQLPNQQPVNLVGWQDLKPGIITTDGSDPAPVASGDTYESLNQEDRQIVDSLIQGMMHVSQMQQNPEAHQDEINAARAALHQELEGGAPQINIQPTTTEHHTCNCGNDHCTCGGHH